MAPRAIWQFMDRDVTHKILHGPKRRCHPQNIIWTEAKLRSIYYFVGDRPVHKLSFGPKCHELFVRDRPFNLKGGLWFFASFRNFFLDNTRNRIFIFFCCAMCEFFFQSLTLGYMTKTLNQIFFFFPPPKSEYFFRKKT